MLSGKRLQLLKEITPKIRRVLAAYDSSDPSPKQGIMAAREAAPSLDVSLVERQAQSREELVRALKAVEESDAYLSIPGGFPSSSYDEITRLTNSKRIPAIFHAGMSSSMEALAGYGVSDTQVAHSKEQMRALPVERPTNLELSINLKTAEQIGLTIPPNVLARADRGDQVKTRTSKLFGFTFCATLFALYSSPDAQPATKHLRLGILEPGNSRNVCEDGFRQGLRVLGYVENANLIIDARYAEFKPDRLTHLASELVQLKSDAIWTHGPTSVHALKRATATVPIVVGVSRNLVERGIISSLARPGGNITGMDLRDGEILGKRLELLKEALPKASRVAVLADPNDVGHVSIPKIIERDAEALRVQLQRVEASKPEDFDRAFGTIVREQADAVILPESPLLSQNRNRIFKIAATKRIPTAAGGSHFAEAGSLISYGASVFDTCQRSAFFVNKIFKGSKPQDLPVERPAKFQLLVNLKTAKQIGVTIPPNVLARADKVIK